MAKGRPSKSLAAARSVAGSVARSQFALHSPARRDIAVQALPNQRDSFWPGAPAYSSDIINSPMATEARRQAMSLPWLRRLSN